ncbi:hypothetical protein BJX64DRAFT_16668 [Aspergillus heterothallicus]
MNQLLSISFVTSSSRALDKSDDVLCRSLLRKADKTIIIASETWRHLGDRCFFFSQLFRLSDFAKKDLLALLRKKQEKENHDRRLLSRDARCKILRGVLRRLFRRQKPMTEK